MKTYRVEYTRKGVTATIEIETGYGPGYAVEEVFARYGAEEVLTVTEV